MDEILPNRVERCVQRSSQQNQQEDEVLHFAGLERTHRGRIPVLVSGRRYVLTQNKKDGEASSFFLCSGRPELRGADGRDVRCLQALGPLHEIELHG